MIEMIAVVFILGISLLLALPSFQGFGSGAKLESSANSMVSALTGTRETAVIDGYSAALEFGTYKDETRDRERQGYRIRASNIRQDLSRDEDNPSDDDQAFDRTGERELIYTEWKPLSEGVVIVGISRAKGNWTKVDSGEPIAIVFGADGNVDQAVAIRLEQTELKEAKKDTRLATVFVNGLTSAASWRKGEHELIASRPASDFGN